MADTASLYYSDIQTFRLAYQKCKKNASKLIKDSYDTLFLEPTKIIYKKNLKDKAVLSNATLEKFLKDTINNAQKWLQDDKKSRSFYLPARTDAVNEFINAAQKIIKSLNNPTAAPPPPPTLPEVGGTLVKSNYSMQGMPFVFDIPLTGTSLGTARCYAVITATGSIVGKVINSDFDFANYPLDGKKFHDATIKNRSIYKVETLEIKLPFALGNIKIQIFISPNDWVSKVGLWMVDMKKELLPPNLL
jgi:hypothetical protein